MAQLRLAVPSRVGHNSGMPVARLPDVRHVALTWSIPDNYGGMTTALFERSRAFQEHGGARVDVLTFDGRVDYPELIPELRERGAIADGTTVINMWDWLRQNSLALPPGRTAPVFTPLDSGEEYVTALRDGRVLTRTRVGADGRTPMQVDYYRDDGSLVASDRRDCRELGVLGGRSIVLCAPDGTQTAHFSRSTPLYYAWVDAVIARDNAVVIIDSKTVANLFVDYQRPRVTTFHVVHGSHLRHPDDPGSGLSPARRKALEHLEQFDAVVVLTARQKKELQRVVGPAGNLRVLPNGLTAPPPSKDERDRTRGIMLASLTARKRVDHAVQAITLARETPEAPVTLDVYGEGNERDRLTAAIDRTGASEAVRLMGHRPGARSHLADASFLLLTSTSEGFPLVLVEAMASGCIPIAYDVRYGAADLIRDGVNGFLVPDGDVTALADAIVRFQRLPDAAVLRMRRHAKLTAAHYSALAITERWASEMRRLTQRHQMRRAVERARRGLRRLRLR